MIQTCMWDLAGGTCWGSYREASDNEKTYSRLGYRNVMFNSLDIKDPKHPM